MSAKVETPIDFGWSRSFSTFLMWFLAFEGVKSWGAKVKEIKELGLNLV
jgi:hypothetical protein